MVELRTDVLVLGAGMVGVGAALHLQKRGRDVILVDRHNLAGEETSYGNAGIIESASVFPYMFPRDFGQILRYALNSTPQVRYRSVISRNSCPGWCVISSRPRHSARCKARWPNCR
jgi:D-amino-acid dehydrogenase